MRSLVPFSSFSLGFLLYSLVGCDRAYRLLDMVSEGCRGHGPVHLLVSSAAEIGFRWDPHSLALASAWIALYFAIWLVLCSIFVLQFLTPGRTKLQLIFVAVRVFGVAPCWIFVGLYSFLTLLMLGIVIKGLLRCGYGWCCLEWFFVE